MAFKRQPEKSSKQGCTNTRWTLKLKLSLTFGRMTKLTINLKLLLERVVFPLTFLTLHRVNMIQKILQNSLERNSRFVFCLFTHFVTKTKCLLSLFLYKQNNQINEQKFDTKITAWASPRGRYTRQINCSVPHLERSE